MTKKKLIDHILYVFGWDFLDKVLGEAEDLHNRATAMVYWFILTLAVASGINLISAVVPGIRVLNLCLLFVFNFMILRYGTRPRLDLAVGLAGAVLGDGEGALERAKEFLRDKWFNALFGLLLWGTLFLLVAATIPFAEYPKAILIILASLLLLTWINLNWGFSLKYAKTLVYSYTVFVLFLSFALLIPRPTYIKVAGFYPFDLFSTTKVEKKLVQVELAAKQYKIEKEAEFLDRVRKQVRQSGFDSLTKKDRERLIGLLKSRDKETLPAKVVGRVKKVLAKKKPKPKQNKNKTRLSWRETHTFTGRGQFWATRHLVMPKDRIVLIIKNNSVNIDSGGGRLKKLRPGHYVWPIKSGGVLAFISVSRKPATVIVMK